MSLENSIKEWVRLDNRHTELNNELKQLREKKNEFSNEIVNFFELKQISNPTINITGGKINLIDQKTCNPMSYKFLEDCFKEFFKNNDEKICEDLLNFIKSKRSYSNNKNLKRIVF